jgi:hypothetical protein
MPTTRFSSDLSHQKHELPLGAGSQPRGEHNAWALYQQDLVERDGAVHTQQRPPDCSRCRMSGDVLERPNHVAARTGAHPRSRLPQSEAEIKLVRLQPGVASARVVSQWPYGASGGGITVSTRELQSICSPTGVNCKNKSHRRDVHQTRCFPQKSDVPMVCGQAKEPVEGNRNQIIICVYARPLRL